MKTRKMWKIKKERKKKREKQREQQQAVLLLNKLCENTGSVQ